MSKEMQAEVTALVGAIAKAFGLSEAEAAAAVEQEQVAIILGSDEDGRRFVRVAHGDRAARIYPGAIFHETEAEPAQGGCACGH